MRFLNEKLVPFSTKVAQNRYIQSIGQGAMGLMAIILVGSIFNLLNTLPFEPYQAFLAFLASSGFRASSAPSEVYRFLRHGVLRSFR